MMPVSAERLRNSISPQILLVLALIFLLSDLGLAQGRSLANYTVPYTSYLFDFWENTVPAPQPYLPTKVIKGQDLEVGSFSTPKDLSISPRGDIYIADTGNNRIVVFDSEWNLVREISQFVMDGEPSTFNQPTGIYVTDKEHLYVADTNNARLVHFDENGQFVRVIAEPYSEVEGVLPANLIYRPLKVVVDRHERIYVIARDVFDGILSFSADGDFKGFVGAPRVTPSLTDYIWSRLATREQRERIRQFLPTEYSGFDLDREGFIYATSTDEDKDESEGGIPIKIRKLNPKGEDLLRRLGFTEPMGDVRFPDRHSLAARKRSSIMVDITVQDYGVYSVLDANRGRVFTYDNNGNLLYMFGYIGRDHGQIYEPVAIDHRGLDIFILDSRDNSVVVFEPTDYTLLIWSALESYHRGDYEQSQVIWEKVLALNTNNDVAYTGIARTMLRRGQYAEAMEYFKLGNNRPEYSDAFELYRKEVIYSNFSKVAWTAVVLIVLGVIAKRVIAKRRPAKALPREVAVTDEFIPASGFFKRTLESLRFALYVIIHPVDGFTKLKYEKRGTFAAATVILGLLILTYVFARQYTGFIFNTAELTKLNLLVEAMSVIVPFILWCAVNWALTTLMDGKGTFKDIYIATAFALVPLILMVVPLTIASNYITLEEGTFYYMLMTFGTLWAAVVLVSGAVMTTHEYTFQKTVFTCIFTVAGMAFTMFLGFLFFSLSEQVVLFARDIFVEIVHRT